MNQKELENEIYHIAVNQIRKSELKAKKRCTHQVHLLEGKWFQNTLFSLLMNFKTELKTLVEVELKRNFVEALPIIHERY